MRHALLLLSALLLHLNVELVQAQEKLAADFPALSSTTDWPWWRGMNRNGLAAESNAPPSKFSNEENVKWKTAIPGRGHSSPIVVGNAVYLTTADEQQQIHSVIAYDKGTGKTALDTADKSWRFSRTQSPKEYRGDSNYCVRRFTVVCDVLSS